MKTLQALSVAFGATISSLYNPTEFLTRLASNIEHVIAHTDLASKQVKDLRLVKDSIADDLCGCNRFIHDADYSWWNESRY